FLSGVRIGEVKDIRLDENDRVHVTAFIEEKYRKRVFLSTHFGITGSGSFLVDGEKMIELLNSEKSGRFLENGEVVPGLSESEFVLRKRRQDLDGIVSFFKGKIDKTITHLEQLELDAQMDAFLQTIQELEKQARGFGQDEFKKFSKHFIPWVDKKIDEFKKHLREMGQNQKAEKFDQKARESRELLREQGYT
ncbi:MAG: MlaD family protein, partial [Nitrospinota bacterium]